MKRMACVAVMLALGAAAVLAEGAATTQPVSVDLSTPQAAVRTYLLATSQGDAAAARQAVIATPAQQQAIDAAGELIRSWNRMGQAARQKFPQAEGDAAEALNQMQVRQDRKRDYMLKALADAEVKREGDKATIRFKAGSETAEPIVLHRQGEAWKVEMDSLGMGRDAEEMTQLMKAMAKVADEMTQGIESGQYPDLAAARDAFAQRATARRCAR